MELCGGFDREGRLVDGWEVHTSGGGRRELHRSGGRLNGLIRVQFEEGDFWVGNQSDGLLQGRREYRYENGQLWQENGMERGQLHGDGRSWFRNGAIRSIFRASHGKVTIVLEWDEAGTLTETRGDVSVFLDGKTAEQLRDSNRLPSAPPEEIAEPQEASGPLGSRDNPILCGGPAGERAYLNRLRCPNGEPPRFQRLGSVAPTVDDDMIDVFEVKCEGTNATIFLDMYHDTIPTEPVDGFTLAPDEPEVPSP